jgi:radical SAM superfamily enzyme YgiQ (UPF0313 family)
MNVLMIYPEYPVTFWSFKYALKYVARKAAFPPLGLLTVAALLPPEWNLRLVDLNVRKLKDSDFQWADRIMISAMLVQRKSVDEILERCRAFDKTVVAGGPLFSAAEADYIGCIDHLVLGEAECTLPLFLEDVRKGAPQRVYRVQAFPSLADTPVPRWDLIDIRNYASLMIQYSRGCPFDCDFCDITNLFGKAPRLKSADQFLQELEALYAKGWRGSTFIVDDNFIGNRVAIKAMLPRLIDWLERHDHPFDFFTEASINLADDEALMRLMVEAGFDHVFVGLETPNEESLKECSKKQNCGRDLTTAIKKIQRSGLAVLGGYIVGFDHDDESIFARQIKFIQESGVVTAMVGLLNAIPNTRLWRRLKAENRIQVIASGDNMDGSVNFISKMDRAKLLEGYQKIIKTIYSPRAYYLRICEFLRHYHPQGRSRVDWKRLQALGRSVFYIGILGNGVTQWYYWKIVVKSLLFYRKAFPEVITLMIYGQHFRKIARRGV